MVNMVQTNSGKTIVLEKDSREYLLEELVKKIEALGRVPTREEMSTDGDMPAINNYVYIFSSYDQAVEEAMCFKSRKEGIKQTAKVRAKYAQYFHKISSPSSQQ